VPGRSLPAIDIPGIYGLGSEYIARVSATAPAEPDLPVRSSGALRAFDRWFRAVKMPPDAPGALASAAREGSVVFVMRSAGLLNFLFLTWLARRLGLPPLRAALGLRGVLPWLARVRSGERALEEAIARGETAIVFLSGAAGPDPFPILSRVQRGFERPLLLVPALLVWTRRARKLKPSIGDLLFGTPEAPSRLAVAIGFLLNRERAVLRVGTPLHLAAFVRDRAGEADATLGRKLRGALHLHLAREVRSVVGPPLKTAARVREMVSRDRELRAALARIASDTGRPLAEVAAEADRDVQEIASRYSPAFIELVRPVLAWLFRKMYDGVEVDEEGLARVRRAAADSPIVLCPSHKSHIDYLVMSLVFSDHGMTPPHIAAGINLAFWPFGAIARRGGGFFIRRTVKGDRVYTAALRAYVKQLLRDGFPQEFYLEGGRSRTGKLLFPKTGLFSMQVDAWLEGAVDDVLFVPVAIDYERLMEASAYARELSGGEKRKEDFRALLRTRKILRRRYGRLYLQFEEPVSLRAIAEERLGPLTTSLTLPDVMDAPDAAAGAPAEGARRDADPRRQLVQAVANHVAYGIQRAITITPVGLVAASLLSHVRRGITATDLARRIELLRFVASEGGARFAKGFSGSPSDPRHDGPIAAAVASLAADGLVRVDEAAGEVIYSVPDEKRLQLDFPRNAVLHRYVALSLVSAALRARGLDAPEAEVKEEARFLSRLFKLEFMYRVGARFDEVFAENVAFLERLGIVVRSRDRLRAGRDRDALEFLADLTRAYGESYRVAAEALAEIGRTVPDVPFDRKALVGRFLEHGRGAFLAGRISQREAISRPTFENAVEWFVQQGALVPAADRGLRIDPFWRVERLPALLAAIERTVA
jgi:glycerol-3-phosphate O-acyltransferase